LAEVRVRAYPRIHLGLIDLGRATGRKFGGAGVVLETHPTQIVVRHPNHHSDSEEIAGDALDPATRTACRDMLARCHGTGFDQPVHINVEHAPTSHIGLGSKTTLLLSIAAGVRQLTGIPLTDTDLQRLSGRGGASGVGIHGFFQGGLIVDVGHADDGGPYAPSGAGSPRSSPTLLARHPVAAELSFYLIIFPGLKGAAGADELAFFNRHTPIPQREVLKSLAHLLFGVVPALIEADTHVLQEHLAAFQALGFKAREVQAAAPQVQAARSALEAARIGAIGMTSMGPTLFAIADQADLGPKLASQLPSAEIYGPIQARNSGYELL
jgi:beta-ribofuranosylaminobenzene 5'-phosphate synthase